jgi:hypothetical protein
VQVPSLSRLKSLAGEAVLSPEVRLEQMQQLGMLPIETRCACCRAETKDVAYFWVICERIEVEQTAGRGLLMAIVMALMFGLFFYVLIIMYLFRRDSGEKERGRDVRLRLPLRICGKCSPLLADHSDLEQAVWSSPAYDALLDKYPHAELGLETTQRGVDLKKLPA